MKDEVLGSNPRLSLDQKFSSFGFSFGDHTSLDFPAEDFLSWPRSPDPFPNHGSVVQWLVPSLWLMLPRSPWFESKPANGFSPTMFNLFLCCPEDRIDIPHHGSMDCPRRGTAGTNGTSGGNVEAPVAATPTGNNTSAESSQVQDQDNSVDDNVSEGTSQTQQD
ncbi:hypothetical protein K435DRAFT_878768 [Dendrothele bispora CBS 962.96]|uniref:Uncharacterized protein n=1 Tax=Dendrothele bispora (strain CBS 962.96) TaxID=1314807 RepID=A0A4S8KMC1_DENBC|nr:hypothetical protein K435DRAFT_878768 [Dendrothele bispora CBS 962.96]